MNLSIEDKEQGNKHLRVSCKSQRASLDAYKEALISSYHLIVRAAEFQRQLNSQPGRPVMTKLGPCLGKSGT